MVDTRIINFHAASLNAVLSAPLFKRLLLQWSGSYGSVTQRLYIEIFCSELVTMSTDLRVNKNNPSFSENFGALFDGKFVLYAQLLPVDPTLMFGKMS